MRAVIFTLSLFGLVPLSVVTAQAFEWQELGETTYGMCAGCHGAAGEGIQGVFPPFAGHLPAVVALEGGRTFLINTLLYGLSGEVVILGEPYNGYMSAWETLSDEQIAAVLNHSLYAWGNDAQLPEDFGPILPEEVAAARGAGLSSGDVFELRKALNLGADE